MKIYTAWRSSSSGGQYPDINGIMRPTRELAEEDQRKHGGTVIEEEVADDSEEAATMREVYPGHFEVEP